MCIRDRHNADSLVERADRPCTDGCNGHQEVFVKYLTAADVLDSRQQDMAAEQQVSRDEPVSYTHLDVYKRQTVGSAFLHRPQEFESLPESSAHIPPIGAFFSQECSVFSVPETLQ